MQEHYFGPSAYEDCSMQENHPAKAGIIHSGGATRDHFLLVTPGNAEFHQAQSSDSAKKNEKGDNAQFHCSSKNSALKPGPKAHAMAYSPVFRGRFSSHS